MFLRFEGEGPSEGEIGEYVERLKELVAGGCRIKLVQVYTVARGTAVAACAPVPAGELDGISERVRRGTGLTVETYYGPA
jgi:hypothetical protein